MKLSTGRLEELPLNFKRQFEIIWLTLSGLVVKSGLEVGLLFRDLLKDNPSLFICPKPLPSLSLAGGRPNNCSNVLCSTSHTFRIGKLLVTVEDALIAWGALLKFKRAKLASTLLSIKEEIWVYIDWTICACWLSINDFTTSLTFSAVKLGWDTVVLTEGLRGISCSEDSSFLPASKFLAFEDDLVLTLFTAKEFDCLLSLVILDPHTGQSEWVLIAWLYIFNEMCAYKRFQIILQGFGLQIRKSCKSCLNPMN